MTRGLILGVLLVSPSVRAALIAEGQALQGPYELRAYTHVAQDLLLYDDVPDSVLTRSDWLRSARLGVRLRWHEDWILRAAGNFAHEPTLRDLSLEYRRWPLRVTVGRFPEPFSLGASINSSDTLLISRPAPVYLGPAYGFGLGFSYRGDRWGWSGGAFSREAGSTLSGRYPENALSTRLTWRPLLRPQGFLHFGLSASLRQTETDSGVQLFGAAESVLVRGLAPRSPAVATTDRYQLLGAETAVRLGPVVLLGEYIRAAPANGPVWHGEYVEAAWALTGERRSYSTRYGVVGGVLPTWPVTQWGPGAWELAVRASATDLSAGGGDMGRVLGAGLNWYPADALRISFGAEQARRRLADGSEREGRLLQMQLRLSL